MTYPPKYLFIFFPITLICMVHALGNDSETPPSPNLVTTQNSHSGCPGPGANGTVSGVKGRGGGPLSSPHRGCSFSLTEGNSVLRMHVLYGLSPQTPPPPHPPGGEGAQTSRPSSSDGRLLGNKVRLLSKRLQRVLGPSKMELKISPPPSPRTGGGVGRPSLLLYDRERLLGVRGSSHTPPPPGRGWEAFPGLPFKIPPYPGEGGGNCSPPPPPTLIAGEQGLSPTTQ
jgi:hypothetical protein